VVNISYLKDKLFDGQRIHERYEALSVLC